ncbi:MAG: Hsp33 family molecular chaperone HslO [Gammaproteobacteria bacterium]|nr:Hsp33 family molecular chaperone HslO [Gammaproteobacteria bacterium]
MKQTDRDSLHRFLFEQMPVRGEIVHLDASWRAAMEHVDYAPAVRDLLGDAMAASVLMASTLKFKGALTLQLQGEGDLKLLVVQCGSDLNLRGLARLADEVDGLMLEDQQSRIEGRDIKSLAGDKARLVITIEQDGEDERYQGIVPLEKETLAECFEDYFLRSEQLPTRMFLAANAETATGMLLQVMPGHEEDQAAWQHVTTLGETITGEELARLDAETILHRLYHEDDVRLFESAPVAFRCTCSRERIADMLRSLGEKEIESILAEQGSIGVSCEFCAREYLFDAVDAAALFVDSVTASDKQSH